MGDKQILAFLRIDVNPAGNAHEVGAIGEKKETVLVHIAHIANCIHGAVGRASISTIRSLLRKHDGVAVLNHTIVPAVLADMKLCPTTCRSPSNTSPTVPLCANHRITEQMIDWCGPFIHEYYGDGPDRAVACHLAKLADPILEVRSGPDLLLDLERMTKVRTGAALAVFEAAKCFVFAEAMRNGYQSRTLRTRRPFTCSHFQPRAFRLPLAVDIRLIEIKDHFARVP
jgi:hypothetical protein